MSIIIFLIILSVLVIVHEVGHFSIAKKFGVRVDEFGLGYPPRAKRLFSWRGTEFTLNWLPFGGFVKIFGENPAENLAGQPPSDNFQAKSKGVQALVLVAGVVFNLIFAWLLISLGFLTGIPAPAGLSLPVENPQTIVTTVIPGSPAAEAGLKSGDAIVALRRGDIEAEISPAAISEFIAQSEDKLEFLIKRGERELELEILPSQDIIPGRNAIGISMDNIGIVRLPPHKALWYGLTTTVELTWLTAKALGGFIAEALLGRADLSQVTGPVGIVGMVGDVRELGFAYLIIFTALISINLALINLVPFPALDGGRLLFVGIEAVSRKPIPPRVFNIVNTVGFGLLILLMILVTVRDVRNIL